MRVSRILGRSLAAELGRYAAATFSLGLPVTAPSDSASPSTLPRLGVRVAATLCAVTGIVGALRTIGIVIEVASVPNAPRLLMVTNPSAVLAVLVAAVLIWQRRRLGAYLLIAGAILPDFVNLAYGQPLRRAAS
jgi:hypothetical protein